MQKFHLTQSGLDKFQAELSELKQRRPQIAEAIAAAREQGDLSENSGYQTAKEEQDVLESRIREIENMLKNVNLIGGSRRQAVAAVDLGSTVHLQDLDNSAELVFAIVGTMEADPSENKISDESMVGQNLLGKTIGEEVILPRPDGASTCKIIAIN